MNEETFQSLMALWDAYRPLIQEGYDALDKTIVLGLPATSMPAESDEKDTGIGSPYGEGAARIWRFWHGVIHKIMQGPIGKTSAKTWHSPYLSSWDYNPFFLDLDKLYKKRLISKKTLDKIYQRQKNLCYIDFKQVESDYTEALTEAYKKSKSELPFTAFCNKLVQDQMRHCGFTYIGDIPINVPTRVSDRHPDWFLKDWSLGAPPDQYSATPQKWGFPILHPHALFTKNPTQHLGPAGRMFKKLLHFYFRGNKGGIRIDHFIGWVDPYCFYTGKKNYPNGRLYSSPKHPLLKKFYLKDKADFRRMTAEFLLPFFNEFHLSSMDIYPEDLGIRPQYMDSVLRSFHLGRMVPVQFNDPAVHDHLYHAALAMPEDIAVTDTHDNPSLLDFFTALPHEKRELFARQLAEDLRFNYTDDLTQPTWLYRMQLGSVLASPAKRVMIFFTSLMGQKGRYNTPGVVDSWHLRCHNHFDQQYFLALREGRAYNPFEAICFAIYARGDAFYHVHEDLVHRLRQAESTFFNTLQNL
ncbi:MAG: 4-alpha-glucanotransferase [Alphaproteobacteria bacterium]|nr:4-alpha-glucanotransferase [Alphaproteobacteria bacterium]